MSNKKLVSVMMMVSGELEGSPDNKARMALVEERLALIGQLEEELNDLGFCYDEVLPDVPAEQLSVRLHVADEYGDALCARAKLYPMTSELRTSKDRSIHHQIDMIHRNTGSDGRLEVSVPTRITRGFKSGSVQSLPVTGYLLEVTRGSEYERTAIAIPMDELRNNGSVHLRLKRLVDMKGQGWFAGDLHHHSIFSSPRHGGTDKVTESPEEVRDAMLASGLDFGALSDHHNILNHQEWLRTASEDFIPILSKEISTTNGHVMSMNVATDVVYRIPEPTDRTTAYLVEEHYRTAGEIKQAGGLSQINHPMDLQAAISLADEMKPHIGIFDTMEIWNGSIPLAPGTSNYDAFLYWLTLMKEGRFIPATSGSDTHNTHADDYHQMVDRLVWLSGFISRNTSSALKKFKPVQNMLDRCIDTLLEWCEETLGTGGVRVYIKPENPHDLTPDDVMTALRSGRSFLTNGPLLVPAGPVDCWGDTVLLDEGEELFLKLNVYSRKKLDRLAVLTGKGTFQELDLSHLPLNTEQPVSIRLPSSRFAEDDFVVLKLLGNPSVMAVTNPVFIRKGIR